MSAQLIRPGLMFEAVACPQAWETVRLQRTASTYQYGDSLEFAPRPNECYVVCNDLSIQSVDHPEKPIGWALLEENDVWSYVVTQVGFTPVPCHLRYRGVSPNPPTGHFSGCSQDAIIIDFDDDSESEVSSSEVPRNKTNPFFSIDD